MSVPILCHLDKPEPLGIQKVRSHKEPQHREVLRILYRNPYEFAPAPILVMTTSRADTLLFYACQLEFLDHCLQLYRIVLIDDYFYKSQCPARASSIELSTTS